MNTAQVVADRIEANRRLVIPKPLTEGIREPSEAALAHPQRQVRSLNVRH